MQSLIACRLNFLLDSFLPRFLASFSFARTTFAHGHIAIDALSVNCEVSPQFSASHRLGCAASHGTLCPTEAAGLQTSSQQELRGCLLQDAGAAMAALISAPHGNFHQLRPKGI